MKALFADFCVLGNSIGCHINPEEIFIVTSSNSVYIATSLFQEEGFKITTVILCSGGFLGSVEDANN